MGKSQEKKQTKENGPNKKKKQKVFAKKKKDYEGELFINENTSKMGKPQEKKQTKENELKKKQKVKVFAKKKKDDEGEVIKNLQEKYSAIEPSNIKQFTDLPLSSKTLKGLKESGYTKPTEIQKVSIGLALQGKDILGAAKTGSGKTLAFVIPTLEALYCKQWSRLDGVGAVVITPTRELAYQIFETLRKVGRYHNFSAGLIIGGKDLKFERSRMDQCNIVICTPGRLLQHMDENPLLDCVNMQMLILDEADRILDMGFKKTMNEIVANLPLKRQTLLFSATQTKSVKDLARLSLKDPSYVAVHEHEKHSTPSGLEQSYVICKLEDKVSILWSFIKNHLKQKCIVFFSTCKQVKFFFEMFSKLRPGVSLMALYGTLHQQRRMNVYDEFSRKKSAVLFATDLVSRGLDFPEVHWVVQADCPEDADAYIHRVGRTARYHSNGESLMLVLPSETTIVDQLEEKKIPINKIEINPNKLNNPVAKMRSFLFNEDLKETAKRAFVHYVKSYVLMKNKAVFKAEEIDKDAFALSLGLTIVPRVRFLERKLKAKEGGNIQNVVQPTVKEISNKNHVRFDNDNKKSAQNDVKLTNGNHNEEIDDEEDPPQLDTQGMYDAMRAMAKGGTRCENPEVIQLQAEFVPTKTVTKVSLAKKMIKKNKIPNKKIIFDDVDEEGDAEQQEAFSKFNDLLEKDRKVDKQICQQIRKEKRKEEKRKLKLKNKGIEQEDMDEFGTDSEDERPDLSWLPDPDKIYGKKKGSNKEEVSEDEQNSEDDFEESNVIDDTQDEEGDDQESSEEESIEEETVKNNMKHKGKKRKMLEVKQEDEGDDREQKEKEKKKRKMEKISKSLSVNEAEELALMLLRK